MWISLTYGGKSTSGVGEGYRGTGQSYSGRRARGPWAPGLRSPDKGTAGRLRDPTVQSRVGGLGRILRCAHLRPPVGDPGPGGAARAAPYRGNPCTVGDDAPSQQPENSNDYECCENDVKNHNANHKENLSFDYERLVLGDTPSPLDKRQSPVRIS